MAVTLETHRITVNNDFVKCVNDAKELRARTALVAHLDLGALVFVPWENEHNEHMTLFYPAYLANSIWGSVDIKQLILNLALEHDEGAIFGTHSSYTMQPCLGIFPRNRVTTITILNRWLNSNRLWLDDRESLKPTIYQDILNKISKVMLADAHTSEAS